MPSFKPSFSAPLQEEGRYSLNGDWFWAALQIATALVILSIRWVRRKLS